MPEPQPTLAASLSTQQHPTGVMAPSARLGHLVRLLVLATGAIAVGCSNAAIEPLTKPANTVDDRLTVAGRVCTSPPDNTGFPVKVVLIVDQSGSMCVSDPPGSQASSGFCELFALGVPPTTTQPARFGL